MNKNDHLIFEYLTFAENVAKKQHRRVYKYFSQDELIATAYYALTVAARKFSGEGEFINYAGGYIKGELKKHMCQSSLFSDNNGRRSKSMFSLETQDTSQCSYEVNKKIKTDIENVARSILSDYRFCDFQDYYIFGLSIKQIAEKSNRTEVAIRKSLSKAREKIRKNYNHAL